MPRTLPRGPPVSCARVTRTAGARAQEIFIIPANIHLKGELQAMNVNDATSIDTDT